MEPSASTGPTAARAAANRLRGPALLSAIALLGFGLVALGTVQSPPAKVAILRQDGGLTVIIALDLTAEPAFLRHCDVRMVISRRPITFDEARSVVQVVGGTEVVLPPRWATALVDRYGRLSPHPGEIDPRRVDSLLRETSVEGTRRFLIAWDPSLEKFFLD